MFSFFSSKNKKLVKRWKKEHKELVYLANKVNTEYKRNNEKSTKKALKKLLEVAAVHLMEEDIGINDLIKDKKRSNPRIEEEVTRFKHAFADTKKALTDFLWINSRDDTIFEKTFYDDFNTLVSVLAQRIEFEENNLYEEMTSK